MLLLAAERRAGAQNFSLYVTNTASTLETSNFLTYGYTITNISGLTLANVTVTNIFPPSIQPYFATVYTGIFTNYPTATNDVMVFELGSLADGTVAQFSLEVLPTAAGVFTNFINLTTTTFTNVPATNLVTDVTNPVINADLGITMTGPAQAVITNDFMTYGLAVTNLGPSSAPGVLVTNLLPGGVLLKAGSPTNVVYTMYPATTNANNTATNLVFNIGTLADGGSFQFSFLVMPTIATTNLTLMASVGASGVTDLNTNNDTATTNIEVYAYLTNGFAGIVLTNSQPIDPVTGFIEQIVLITNISGATMPAARVLVTGVSNQLYNASGTNSGYPFVDYSTPLPAGQTATLTLQFVRSGAISTNEGVYPFALPFTPVWPAPAPSFFATNVPLTRIVSLTGQTLTGGLALIFPSYTNRTYTVVYSDNVLFSNAQVVVPPIISGGNEVVWVDYGAPGTTSKPPNGSARFYQVYLNNTNSP